LFLWFCFIDLLRVPGDHSFPDFGTMTWFEIEFLHEENRVGTGDTVVSDQAKIRYSIRNVGCPVNVAFALLIFILVFFLLFKIGLCYCQRLVMSLFFAHFNLTF
jgi:hypothetical protein